MMKYKRLTDKEQLEKISCYNCNHNYAQSITCERYCADGDYFELRPELDRLAELEDKIEQGTLIELPCKVDDTVYQFSNGGMEEQKQIEEMAKEKCEHFDKEVCSKLNCKKDCKYYGKSNCYRCIHKEICQLRTFSYCEEEVKEKGCEYYQQEIPENAVLTVEELKEKYVSKNLYELLQKVSNIRREQLIKSGEAFMRVRKETEKEIFTDLLKEFSIRKSCGNADVVVREMATRKGVQLE